jgi:DNA-directed RNA polymerase specialized sigma24 family protein
VRSPTLDAGSARDAVEDLTQEVFVRLLEGGRRALSRFRGQGDYSIYTYLSAIGVNIVRDHFKKFLALKTPRGTTSMSNVIQNEKSESTLNYGQSLIGDGPGPDHFVASHELREGITSVLAETSRDDATARDRPVFRLFFIEGLTVSEGKVWLGPGEIWTQSLPVDSTSSLAFLALQDGRQAMPATRTVKNHLAPADLYDFIENRITRSKRHHIETHLDQCPDCVEALAMLLHTERPASREKADRLAMTPAVEPEALFESLRPAIVASGPGASGRSSWDFQPFWPPSLLASSSRLQGCSCVGHTGFPPRADASQPRRWRLSSS